MKYRLLAPGPTMVPDRVLKEISMPIIHHRTAKFEQTFADCKEGLNWLLGTKESPLILTNSGTGAFEAAIQNFFNKNDKVLCVTGGKFGENWYKLSKIYGLNAIEIPVEWGEAVDVELIEQELRRHKDIKGVIVVASETSTGVRHPYEKIAALVKEYNNCLLMVDAVTAVGVWDIDPQRDGIDILIVGSQKGLMLPPGLAFLWASERAFSLTDKVSTPKFYFDLNKERKAQKKNQTSYTPAVNLIMGLRESLSMMQEEGRSNIFLRHERLGQATRAAMLALGLKLVAKNPSNAITSVYSPDGLFKNAIYDHLAKTANFTIAKGQGEFADKIFRIGHMGYVDEIDLIGVFGAIELVLKKLGYEKFELGSSFKAAGPILQGGFGL